jgi:hypothetical protein
MAQGLRPDEKEMCVVQPPLEVPSGFSESSLYSPNARQIQDWGVREVLPASRKDGAYIAGEEKVLWRPADTMRANFRALIQPPASYNALGASR